MNRRTICTSIAIALITAVAAVGQPAASGYLDVYVAKVKQDKRPQFDSVTKKFAAANRQHKGDNWVAYQVEYGEANTVYFVSVRNNYAGIDEGVKAFMGALKSAYGAQMTIFLAENDSYLIGSRSEIRARRPDLSSNLPADNAALNRVVGKSRFLRIVTIRTRPGRGPDFEAELLNIKAANEKQTPGRVTTVSQSSVGAPLGIYYLTNFGDSYAALASPKTLQELLGDRGYRNFQKNSSETTINAEIIICRWMPELSNPPAEIASADPAFWNPKPPAPPKAKPDEKK